MEVLAAGSPDLVAEEPGKSQAGKPMLAPVVLFVYNRPNHTRQTLESLMANELADQSALYIYADGPQPSANAEAKELILQTRALIREKQWCKQVHIHLSDHNRGLAASVVNGVTEIVNRHGKVIVLEDDLVLSPGFLRFMNEGLELYQNSAQVYSVNAYMFPLGYPVETTVLLPYASTWGWATWKEKWAAFDADMPQKKAITKNLHLQRRFNLADYDYTGMLDFTSNSWGIRWYYTVFVRNGLGVFPTKSLVRNIGFDGSGTNQVDDKFKKNSVVEFIQCSHVEQIDLEFYDLYLEFFNQPKNTKIKKILTYFNKR
jgi:hypothetical protein